jgi:hypothetical protein
MLKYRAVTILNLLASLTAAIIVGCLLIVGCGKAEPIDKASRQKFIDVYVDLTLVYWNSQKAPINYQSMAAAVYNKYDIDKSFLIKTQKKLDNNPPLQHEIYQEIVNRLKKYEDIPVDSLSNVLDSTIDLR